MTNLLKPNSNMTNLKVTCAYCDHKRNLPIFSQGSEEHIWCTKCGRTSRYVLGTETAYKLEDIKHKQEEYEK